MTTDTAPLRTNLGEYVRVDRTSNAEERPPLCNSPVVAATILHESARVSINGIEIGLPKDEVVIRYKDGQQAHMRKEVFALNWTRKK